MWVTMHKDSPVMSLNTKLARLKIVGASRHALAPEGAGEQGQHAAARRHTEHALRLYRGPRAPGRAGPRADRSEQAGVLTRLGDAHRALGVRPAARENWRHALAVLDDLHHPGAAQVVSRLDDLRAAL